MSREEENGNSEASKFRILYAKETLETFTSCIGLWEVLRDSFDKEDPGKVKHLEDIAVRGIHLTMFSAFERYMRSLAHRFLNALDNEHADSTGKLALANFTGSIFQVESLVRLGLAESYEKDIAQNIEKQKEETYLNLRKRCYEKSKLINLLVFSSFTVKPGNLRPLYTLFDEVFKDAGYLRKLPAPPLEVSWGKPGGFRDAQDFIHDYATEIRNAIAHGDEANGLIFVTIPYFLDYLRRLVETIERDFVDNLKNRGLVREGNKELGDNVLGPLQF